MVNRCEPLINVVIENKPKVLTSPRRANRLGPKGKGSGIGAPKGGKQMTAGIVLAGAPSSGAVHAVAPSVYREVVTGSNACRSASYHGAFERLEPDVCLLMAMPERTYQWMLNLSGHGQPF
jgi:hypothetical protein